MIDYLNNLITRLKQKSSSIDKIEAFIEKPWILINETGNYEKYLFRRNNDLIISRNGSVIKAKWEYLSFDKSILIDFDSYSILLSQGLIINGVMILIMEGTNKFFPFINPEIVPDLDLIKYLQEFEKNSFQSSNNTIESSSNKLFKKTYNKGTKITIFQVTQNINPGDSAFLNESDILPDGKYRVETFLSIIVKDGKVIKVL